ncbi:MAG: hypothetical protein DWQ06_11395 [Calditrichaeota bacterium]|nr:MAG: hypothetical protein DWQ06_11395 [Calditrichota bacterium]
MPKKITILAILLFANLSFGQIIGAKQVSLFNLSIINSELKGEEGLGINLSLTKDFYKIPFTLDFKMMGEVDGITFGGSTSPKHKFSQISLLASLFKNHTIPLLLSGGIGYSSLTYRGKFLYSEYENDSWFSDVDSYYEEINENSLTLPIELKIFWVNKNFVGVSIGAFASIRKNNSVIGFNLGFVGGTIK